MHSVPARSPTHGWLCHPRDFSQLPRAEHVHGVRVHGCNQTPNPNLMNPPRIHQIPLVYDRCSILQTRSDQLHKSKLGVTYFLISSSLLLHCPPHLRPRQLADESYEAHHEDEVFLQAAGMPQRRCCLHLLVVVGQRGLLLFESRRRALMWMIYFESQMPCQMPVLWFVSVLVVQCVTE